MQNSKTYIRKRFLIPAILCAVSCISLFTVKTINAAEVRRQEEEMNSLVPAFPDATSELFIGQSYGYCTHDESFTEPDIPDGRYYFGGDENADYYIEITGNTFCLRNSNGTAASDDRAWGGEREYKVITSHLYDAHFFCSEWEEYDIPPDDTVLDKYRMLRGVEVRFDSDGKAYITPFAFRAGEGNVIRPDMNLSYSIPD